MLTPYQQRILNGLEKFPVRWKLVKKQIRARSNRRVFCPLTWVKFKETGEFVHTSHSYFQWPAKGAKSIMATADHSVLKDLYSPALRIALLKACKLK